MKPASPYLTAPEAAVYLKFTTPDGGPRMGAFYTYRYKVKLKAYRRGGKLLFKQSDLDASLYEETPEPRLVRRRA